MADTRCVGAAGYASDLSNYIAETSLCVEETDVLRADVEQELADRVNAARTALGLAPITRRGSLDMAAKAHALDMASRDYVAHADLEGRDHLFRIRAMDRELLVGDFGANVIKLASSTSGAQLFQTLSQDEENALNLVRSSFSDMGIGIAEANGALYLVMTFAEAAGKLEQPIPPQIEGRQSMSASLEDGTGAQVGWSITDASTGALVTNGTFGRLRATRLDRETVGAVDIIVQDGARLTMVKGPLVAR
ncbi:MAG: CAP domain-containing protein [Henriciella sp.]